MPLANVTAATALVIQRGKLAFDVTADFVNAGTIGVLHGTLTLDILATGLSAASQTIDNRGLIAAAGGTLTIHGNRVFEANQSTLVNDGTVLATGGGVVDIQANLRQAGAGKVAIQGGEVLLEGAASGGTIQISAGMLAFGLFGRAAPGGPLAAGQCTSQIQFLGHDGTLDFSGAAISEVFRPATQDLLVSVQSGGRAVQIADLHLGGRVYSAADFTVRGADILFHH